MFFIGILIALVAGNNMATAVGTLVGSNVSTKNVAKFIGIIGFSAGLIFSGNLMTKTSKIIFNYNPDIILLMIISTILIFFLAQWARVPLSLTMAIIGISMGLMIKFQRFYEIRTYYNIIFMWFLAPIFALLLSYSLSKLYSMIKFQDIWKISLLMRFLIIIFSFGSAYTLGENTMGLLLSIYGFNYFSITISIIFVIIGSLFLSDGVLKRLGNEIYSMKYSNALISIVSNTVLVELATMFSIPLSNSQTMTFSILGTGLSSKLRFLIYKPILRIITVWIISPLLGLLLGYLL